MSFNLLPFAAFACLALIATSVDAQTVADVASSNPYFHGLVVGMRQSDADTVATRSGWTIRPADPHRYALVDQNYGALTVELRYRARDEADTGHAAVIERFIVSSEHLSLDRWSEAIDWLASMEETLTLKYGGSRIGHTLSRFTDASQFPARSGGNAGKVIAKWERGSNYVSLLLWRDANNVWGSVDYTLRESR